ncbi:MAG: TonB-dependent receptor plug domain-containing protein [Steroidobacteraceae bacterium]
MTSVFMRGTNSNHTKVLIDGIDVGDPSNSGATFDFGQLLASDIERIEVLRGSAERTVWLRRHRWSHQHHDPLRSGSFKLSGSVERRNISHQQ